MKVAGGIPNRSPKTRNLQSFCGGNDSCGGRQGRLSQYELEATDVRKCAKFPLHRSCWLRAYGSGFIGLVGFRDLVS